MVPPAASRERGELRLADVEAFLSVATTGSINGAARTRGVTPSQVSKAVARLEAHLGQQLIVRTAHGVRLSDGARTLLPRLVDLTHQAQALCATAPTSELTVVAPAYLNAQLLPRIARALGAMRLHSLEAPPGVASALAGWPTFDVALASAVERWPSSWSTTQVGNMRRGLFATPETASRLGASPPEARLRDETFIGPIYSEGGLAVPGDDRCPVPAHQRRIGHRTQTVAMALSLAVVTGDLVFAPAVAARPHVERGELVEIRVPGWRVVDPLVVVCHQDRVSARVERDVVAAVRHALREDRASATH